MEYLVHSKREGLLSLFCRYVKTVPDRFFFAGRSCSFSWLGRFNHEYTTSQVSQDTYFVIIGGATNWLMQGAYFATVRLKAEGHADEYIRAYVQHNFKQDEKISAIQASYDRYLKLTTEENPMDKARFYFVAKNYLANSTEELPRILTPMLAIFGENDLNVIVAKDNVRKGCWKLKKKRKGGLTSHLI